MTHLPAAFGPLLTAQTPTLSIGYYQLGPVDGVPVILLHGYPYDVHSFVDVAPLLAMAGYCVVVPYLRGHGPTTFLREDAPRSGQQAALGQDVVELMDVLAIPRAILAGYDWGGRAACVVAALWPERVLGLVSLNSYLIQDISNAMVPVRPDLEAGFWYFWYFATERGRAGLSANRVEIARVIWERNSPRWKFDEATLVRVGAAFDNPDYVDVVIHSYRHRLGLAAGADEYAEIENRLAQLPPITVPAVTLDGMADGNFPATDGTSSAQHFRASRVHHRIADAGHNLPAEQPQAFAEAIMEVAALAAGTAGAR